MTAWRTVLLLIAKDLRIEARSRQTLGLVIVLGILIIVVLGLGLGGAEPLSGAVPRPSCGWRTCSAACCASRRPWPWSGTTAPWRACCWRRSTAGVIFVAKLLSNLVLMLALAAVVTPVAIVLFGFDLSAAPGRLRGGDAAEHAGLRGRGHAVCCGRQLDAAAGRPAGDGGLSDVPAAGDGLDAVMMAMFRDGQPLGGAGLGILVAFDAIYLVVSWLVFERVLEP